METDKIEATETDDQEESQEITDDEIIGAIDEGLEAAPNSEPDEKEKAPVEQELAVETEGGAVVEPEPEPEAEAEAGAEDDGKPEERASEEQSAKPQEAEKEEKPSDEFGALDKDTPEKTRERFQKLKDGYDSVAAERDQFKSENKQWRDSILQTGTNPEQFGMALEYLSLVNSGKPENMEAAYQIMSKELETIAQVLGKPVPGIHDPLSLHPDLKDRVSNGMLDEKDAHEIASARAKVKLTDVAQKTEQQKAHEQSVHRQALEDVKTLGEQLRASDPMFDQKMPYFESIISAVVTSGTSPERWAAMAKEAYTKLPDIPAPAPTPTSEAKPVAPNPIRPGGVSPSTGMEKEPGNILEAVEQSIARGY